jgi:hypothetical protein
LANTQDERFTPLLVIKALIKTKSTHNKENGTIFRKNALKNTHLMDAVHLHQLSSNAPMMNDLSITQEQEIFNLLRVIRFPESSLISECHEKHTA